MDNLVDKIILTSSVKLEFPGTLEMVLDMCKQHRADKMHTKIITNVVGIKPDR